jgi:hypothetical protein
MEIRIEQALGECANLAHAEVILRLMKGRKPTPEECREQVGKNAQGEPITRAMQLGEEMHRVALKCAQERLTKLRPGGFSIEPRYRYDLHTKKTTLVSSEEATALLSRGRGSELRGTLVPDVVIHAGNPLRAEEVYDFKFPCVDPESRPPWRRYPPGHPHQDLSQGAVYKDALGREPRRVVPGDGIIR